MPIARANYEKLKPTATNKTVVFWSPIDGDEDVLVRTGVKCDDFSIYHALLYGYSREYIEMKNTGRINLVKKFRENLREKLGRKDWYKLADSKDQFAEELGMILLNTYLYLKDSKFRCNTTKTMLKSVDIQNNKQVYQIIKELLPIDTLEDDVFLVASNKHSCLDLYSKDILEISGEELSKCHEFRLATAEQQNYIRKKQKKLFSAMLSAAENLAYTKYKDDCNTDDEVTPDYLSLLSNRINRDIYIINGDTRLPDKFLNQKDNIKQRKSMILLKVGDDYEVVGRLLPCNKVIREFDYRESIVDKIHTYLFDTKNLEHLYPDIAIKLCPSPVVSDFEESDFEESDNSVDQSGSEYDDSDEEKQSEEEKSEDSSEEEKNERQERFTSSKKYRYRIN